MQTVILDWATVTSNNDISPEIFTQLGDTTIYDLTPPKLVAERIGNAEVVLCNKALITSEVIDKCPNLKYIGLFATGYNNIDIPAASSHGITVCNAGGYSTNAVVQHTFALILNHFSKVAKYNKAVCDGEWISSPTFSYFPYATAEIAGKTLAVIGYGTIGKAVADVGSAFGMNVIISTRTQPKDCKYEVVTNDEAVARADILTVHCPLTEKTANLINHDSLSLMKPSAYIINTARGGVVNEQDLADALNNHIIAGAAVDVMISEPMSPDTPLRNAANCTITPHIAWAPLETRQRLVNMVYDNLLSFINGSPKNKVN